MTQPSPTHEFDLFIVHAPGDAKFVREYLLTALGLPRSRVLLIDELPPGGLVVSEIERGVLRSRYTIVVLSPACFGTCAELAELFASYLSMNDVRVIPLRLVDCQMPIRLQARVALDFTDKERWACEVERLCAVLRSSGQVAASNRYLRRSAFIPGRWSLGIFCGVMTGVSLVYGSTLWRGSAVVHPLADMVRFADASIRLGVFAEGLRPPECGALEPSEDCAVLVSASSVGNTEVQSFDLDRLEVSNGDYAAWLNTNIELWKLAPYGFITTRRSPIIPLLRTELCGDGITITSQGRARVTPETARWPVTCVSWYGAAEYCRAHGKRLPLDEEWELAAKGAEGRPFPWGSSLPRHDVVAFERRSVVAAHPRAVGASPQDVTPEGVKDLGGNVAEWVEDQRGDPGVKTLRGGGFGSIGPCHLLSSGCKHIAPDKFQKDIGFRCARSVIGR